MPLLAGRHEVTVFNRGQGLQEAMNLGAGVCGDFFPLQPGRSSYAD